MKIILTIFFSLGSFFSFSQSIKGEWIGEYQMIIQKIDETHYLENSEWISRKLDTVMIDTSYYSSNFIIDFIDDSHVKVCCIKGRSQSTEYTLSNDTIKFVIDTTLYELQYDQNKLQILDLDSGWKSNTVYLKRMNPLSKGPIKINESNKLINSYWKIEVDTLSINYGMELHIIDSGQMVLTQIHGNRWGYSSLARCGYFENDDYTFFWFFDEYALDGREFRIYKKTTTGYLAQSFENQFNNGKPFIKKNVAFIQTSLPTKEELGITENKLIGKWNSSSFSSLFDIDNLIETCPENDYFHLIFNENKSFEIKYITEYTKKSDGKESQIINLSKIKNGTWELGKTGRYIILKTTTKRELEEEYKIDKRELEEEYKIDIYIALVNIEKDNLTIGIDIEGPEEITYKHQVIKLKKGANNGE